MREVSDSLHLRRFCRIALSERVPDESTIRKLVRRLGPEVIEEITRAVITTATTGERRFVARGALRLHGGRGRHPLPIGSRAGGQGEQARRYYTQSLEIRQRLAAAEPDRADYQRDLSISYNKLGDPLGALGQGEQARRYYTQSLEIAQRLAAAEPDRADYQRDLSVSYEPLGDLLRALGEGRPGPPLPHAEPRDPPAAGRRRARPRRLRNSARRR